MRVQLRNMAVVVACASIGGARAHATYSIAAADMSTREVGGAVTSCVGSLEVSVVYGSLPGVGVIHAQAQLDSRLRGKTRAIELMMQGLAPADIVAQITQASFDSGFAGRQYGLVDTQGRFAGYTGERAQAYKSDRQGRTGSFVYSVQGNILTGPAVLDQAVAAFEADGCDLAERLMRALEAGAERGQGDSRCTVDGIPSDSAFIAVDRPDVVAGGYLRLSVTDTGPESPLPKLRSMFDQWRAMHPCTVTAPAAGSSSAGVGGMSGVGGSSGAAGVSGVNGQAGVAGMSGSDPSLAVGGRSGATAASGVAGAAAASAGRAALAGMNSLGDAAVSGNAAGVSTPPGGASALPSAAPGSGGTGGTLLEPRAMQSLGTLATAAGGGSSAAAARGGCGVAAPSRTPPRALAAWWLTISGLAGLLRTRKQRRR